MTRNLASCAAIGFALITAVLSLPALAQQAQSSSESQSAAPEQTEKQKNPLEEVTVTGHYLFLSADTSRTTNLPLPVEKVPQSINIVSNDFINAADLKTLGEIGEYTPGATNNGSDLDSVPA